MLSLEALADHDIFICPRCAASVRSEQGRWYCCSSRCSYAHNPFPVLDGKPALVDFENSVLDADRLRVTGGASEVRRTRLNRLKSRFIRRANPVAPAAAGQMLEALRAGQPVHSRRPRILVVGGGSIGSGLGELYTDPTVDVFAFDVYATPAVQFIADGHSIPLADGAVDGVVIQAVLEHVLEPAVVVKEIYRVLRQGGVVYADTPFMQQVC